MHGKFDPTFPTPGSQTLHITGPIKWDGDSAGDRPARRIRIMTLSLVQGGDPLAIAGHDRPNLDFDRPGGPAPLGEWEFDITTDDGRPWVPGKATAYALVRVTTLGSGIRGSNDWDEPWDETIWLT